MSREIKSRENRLVDSGFPVPQNEMERLLALNELELDYSDLEKSLAELVKMAAKITGTSISIVNLIDTYVQWSVATFGMETEQNPRENSVCQYTILEENAQGMEVKDLSTDERFKDRDFVVGVPYFRYYYGVPLRIKDDLSIGSLCVLHSESRDLSSEKKELLEIVAHEIIGRIMARHELNKARRQLKESQSVKNHLAHDIRGPVSGIVGLSEIIQLQGSDQEMDELLGYVQLIQSSGESVLDLVDEILSISRQSDGVRGNQFTLEGLRKRLKSLFEPQALAKGVRLRVQTNELHAQSAFPKTNLLQILGNLITNSIKFTPEGGEVEVSMDLEETERDRILLLKVKDSGVGMPPEKIEEILQGKATSSDGTSGEQGFGFGLNLVYRLISNIGGKIAVSSELGKGVEFELALPVA